MFLLPIVAGIFFALIGISYRLAQNRGIGTPAVVLYMAAGGVLYFLPQLAEGELQQIPMRVLVLAIASGASQYATIKLCGAALKRGPLSPLWCALNLAFIPVVLYSYVALSEQVTLLQWLGLLAGAAGVFAAAKGQDPSAEGEEHGRSQLAVYAVLLLGALFANSILHGSVKDLGARPATTAGSLLEGSEASFFLLMYLSLGLPLVVECFVLERGREALRKAALACGIMAALGSVGGMQLLALSVKLPAALVFAGSALASLAGGSLASVLFFGERASLRWYAMMGLAVVAVVLVSL